MAVRRRTAGPNPESKTALIVSLVVFVILTIGVGVAAFLGWSAASDKEAALTKEIQKTKAAESGERAQEHAKLLLLYYSGLATPEDAEKLERNRNFQWPAGSEKDKQFFEEKQAKWETELGRTAYAQKNTYIDKIDKLNKDLANMKALVQATQTQLADANKGKQEADAERQQAIERFKADLDDLKKKFVALQTEKSEAFKKLFADHDNMSKEHVAILNNQETKEKEFADKMAAKDKELADSNLLRQKLEDERVRKSPLEYDRPKGKVTSVERGSTVFIDLGSEDRLREGLTFSLVGKSITGKPNKEIKGKIEVVHVEGPHLAKARITETRDYFREPIMVGDLLYNIAWNPYMRERIALAGLVDLRGEGRDNSEDFIKELRKQNIDVDAYLDLKDLAIKGPGMSLHTSFLVLGETPEFAVHETFDGSSKSTERKKDVSVKIAEMQTEAKRLGIEVVPVRKFMNLIGFHLSSGAVRVPPNYNLPASVSTTTSSPAPKDGAKPADKEMPKEKEEKPK